MMTKKNVAQYVKEAKERKNAAYLEKARERTRIWKSQNPEKVLQHHREEYTKGGRYYVRYLRYSQTGLRGERQRIRYKHGKKWREYKNIIAPNSQIHHEWLPGTPEYTGVALVETDQHIHGYIDVIDILDGQITLFREEEIRRQ